MIKKTTPQINKGVATPKSINTSFVRKRKKVLSVDTIVQGILAGNRLMLSKAITLIESTKPAHQTKAQAIINLCLPHSGNAFRLGITGSPGVGKSTFIETFGQFAIQENKQIAVLAVDPTSQISKGSILGDKTRMMHLSTHSKAFIRPSPAGNSLGGVARKTRETIILCEAAGFDLIIIETVGVGQSEIAVHSMVDFFLLLLLPGGGDELQGIKKGIVEMADLIAINKADGENATKAKQSKSAYRNALHLLPPQESQWIPKVTTCSGLANIGMEEIWKQLVLFKKLTKENNFFIKNRKSQAAYWLHETIQNQLKQLFYDNPTIKAALKITEEKILAEELSPFQGAEDLMKLFKS